jgi:hypothetical protein
VEEIVNSGQSLSGQNAKERYGAGIITEAIETGHQE